ncbi:hypothetical protein ABZ608_23565 [Streptomyces sp. NPDC013172]|uniref:DinB/UmuC family translesion DNA polymerase n=1 Tax=Streptomyces sp. NPDC013172 TaxID=3155009 RepID=UPI0033EE0971
MQRLLGKAGHIAVDRARGIEPRTVTPRRLPASVGVRHRFLHDVLDGAPARSALLGLVVELGAELRRRGQAARALTLTLTFAGGPAWEKTRRLAEPSGHEDETAFALPEIGRLHETGERWTRRHQHHPGLQRPLPGRSHRGSPRVHRPPPSPAPQRRIPHPHLRGMGRLPRPLRTTQAFHRHLRPRLRYLVHPRTRLRPLLDATSRARPARPPGRDPRQLPGPHHRGRTRGLAGRAGRA